MSRDIRPQSSKDNYASDLISWLFANVSSQKSVVFQTILPRSFNRHIFAAFHIHYTHVYTHGHSEFFPWEDETALRALISFSLFRSCHGFLTVFPYQRCSVVRKNDLYHRGAF